MEFRELIEKRQSDRRYLDKPVEEEKIKQCIEAAMLAPSACNAQPWTFVVINEESLLKEVRSAASDGGINRFAYGAKAFVAIVLEKESLMAGMGMVIKDKEYRLMDIGMAAEHFCLMAAELGLGTCMIGWFSEKKIKKLLNVPDKKRIPLIISVGYPDTKHREKQRKEFSQICKFNSYK
ncbi:MAG: nitroreductase family protein [Bacteroidales bacterium]|nr:nitroreductase family protein [Candidatus Scybalousia scybalohippi]MCQ2326267.1 nitroreductase family protein [Bacteroidales bacterium]